MHSTSGLFSHQDSELQGPLSHIQLLLSAVPQPCSLSAWFLPVSFRTPSSPPATMLPTSPYSEPFSLLPTNECQLAHVSLFMNWISKWNYKDLSPLRPCGPKCLWVIDLWIFQKSIYSKTFSVRKRRSLAWMWSLGQAFPLLTKLTRNLSPVWFLTLVSSQVMNCPYLGWWVRGEWCWLLFSQPQQPSLNLSSYLHLYAERVFPKSTARGRKTWINIKRAINERENTF